MDYLLIALKLIVSLGILNVWLLRSGKQTAYRGRDAKTLREEFAVYGLPFPVFLLVGFLKISFALSLLGSLWFPGLAQPAAAGMGVLMLGAFVMHLKVRDPVSKALPSLAVLAMCAAIALLSAARRLEHHQTKVGIQHQVNNGRQGSQRRVVDLNADSDGHQHHQREPAGCQLPHPRLGDAAEQADPRKPLQGAYQHAL